MASTGVVPDCPQHDIPYKNPFETTALIYEIVLVVKMQCFIAAPDWNDFVAKHLGPSVTLLACSNVFDALTREEKTAFRNSDWAAIAEMEPARREMWKLCKRELNERYRANPEACLRMEMATPNDWAETVLGIDSYAEERGLKRPGLVGSVGNKGSRERQSVGVDKDEDVVMEDD